MRDLETALRDLQTVVVSSDRKALSTIVLELGVLVVAVEVLPDELVDGLSTLLQDEAFLKIEDSWKVAKLFYDNWVQLSAEQRERLLPVLTQSFDKYAVGWERSSQPKFSASAVRMSER